MTYAMPIRMKEYDARRLATGVAPSTGWSTETWVVHEKREPGRSIVQVTLYFHAGKWHAWTGNFTRSSQREVAKKLAGRRNARARSAVGSSGDGTRRRDPSSSAKRYRGWTIAPYEGTHLGYVTASGKRGKGRHYKGYVVTGPSDETGYTPSKIVDTLAEARAYVDNY